MNENEALGHTFSSWEHEWDGYGRDKKVAQLCAKLKAQQNNVTKYQRIRDQSKTIKYKLKAN